MLYESFEQDVLDKSCLNEPLQKNKFSTKSCGAALSLTPGRRKGSGPGPVVVTCGGGSGGGKIIL